MEMNKITNNQPQVSRLVPSRAFHFCLIFGTLSVILLNSTGCAIIAMAAKGIGEKKPAAYAGLAGQSAGVMVWADRGVRADWPSVQLDLANLIQNKLSKSTAIELKGTTWPVQAASIVRYQTDHPGIEAAPITDIAPKLGVSQLIYIELDNFSTRSEVSMQMFRGNVSATLKIIQTQNGQSSIAYQEASIHAFYPPKSPPEGVMNSDDLTVYRGAIAAMADEIVNRLMTHDVEPESASD